MVGMVRAFAAFMFLVAAGFAIAGLANHEEGRNGPSDEALASRIKQIHSPGVDPRLLELRMKEKMKAEAMERATYRFQIAGVIALVAFGVMFSSLFASSGSSSPADKG